MVTHAMVVTVQLNRCEPSCFQTVLAEELIAPEHCFAQSAPTAATTTRPITRPLAGERLTLGAILTS